MTIANRLLAAVLATAAAISVPATAEACWDGTYAEADRVAVSVADNGTWSPERARQYAKWIGRINALVPEGKTVIVEQGFITICDAQTDGCTDVEQTWDDGQLFTLFETTADLMSASRHTIARARGLDIKPYTIQVAATRDMDGAYRLADSINAEGLGLTGFFDVGGFPAANDYAHVVENFDTGTLDVVVGVFLTKKDADFARTMLEDELGVKGFVRTLDQSTVESGGC